MVPSNWVLDERTKTLMDDVKEIKKDVKDLGHIMGDFITEVKSCYLRKDEAKRMFANKIVQRVLIGIWIAIWSWLLTLAGKALLFYIKNAEWHI